MTQKFGLITIPITIAFLAAPAFCQNGHVFKSADIDSRAAKAGATVALHDGAGYSIQVKSIQKAERSASGESVDQLLWIRSGAGHLSVGSPARRSALAAGDLVRLPRATAYAIEPDGGRLAFVDIRVTPLAAGRPAPAGIRPTRGEMGDVLSKAGIDATIARTEANAPLHAQDNFTVNYVLFKGRVGPWEAHAGCADIYLVQTGTGTIQLGGSIANAKDESPGEPRGTGVSGSRDSAVGAGDLVVIPRNVAHHMNPKTLPLAYVLVKVWSE